ncbi:DUF1445 domain-containing protein [Aquamicrobium sp. LC103]|nr:DUF1445 domain-containing protein [Aquamicrobium sp. LC103]
MPLSHASLSTMAAHKLRGTIRLGAYRGSTSGLASDRLQANLIILPRAVAGDFLRFCKRNPKPLPLVGVSRTGEPAIDSLGTMDLRTDVPRYDVYRFGVLDEQRSNILSLWREDFAAFAVGSSLSFERGLAKRGIPMPYPEAGASAPIFRTTIKTASVGPFGGTMCVSMRPVRRTDVTKVRAITARYPQAHGAPIHIGNPEVIGIRDLAEPDWGTPVELGADEVPVFWASGATASVALQGARLELCITHSPGHMLITDVDGRSDVGAFKIF